MAARNINEEHTNDIVTGFPDRRSLHICAGFPHRRRGSANRKFSGRSGGGEISRAEFRQYADAYEHEFGGPTCHRIR